MSRASRSRTLAIVRMFGTALTAQQATRSELLAQSDRTAAPAFRLTDSGNRPVQLSDFRGKPVVVNFWATECGGCKVELPTFVSLARTYKHKGLIVLGVSMDIMYSDLKDAAAGWSQVLCFWEQEPPRFAP